MLQTITITWTGPELFNVSDRQHWVSKGHLAAKVARRAQGLEPVSCGEQHRKRPIRCVVYDCLVRVRTCGSGLGFHPLFVYLTFGAVSSSIRHLHSPREARASVQPHLVISLDSRAVGISRLITIMWGEPVIHVWLVSLLLHLLGLVVVLFCGASWSSETRET